MRTSNELKITIEAARLACPETKDETHLLPLPLFDPADQRVRSGMSVRTEMPYDGKTRRILVDALEVFIKTFPQSTSSLADVNRDLQIRLRLRVRVFQRVPGAHARLREAVTSTRSLFKISSPS